MEEIRLLKSLYTKQSILYTMNLYLEKYNYSIDDDAKYFILNFDGIKKKDFDFIKEELNFNSLRFEIADNNKEIRKSIISQAL
jgi:hypothetical protein